MRLTQLRRYTIPNLIMPDREVKPTLSSVTTLQMAEALGELEKDLEGRRHESPETLRRFFYGNDFSKGVAEVIKAVRLFGAPGQFVPHRQIIHPSDPDFLNLAVYARRFPDGRRGIFLLHAMSAIKPNFTAFLPLNSQGRLQVPTLIHEKRDPNDGDWLLTRRFLQPSASFEDGAAPLLKNPLIALYALSEATARLRTVLEEEELLPVHYDVQSAA